LSTKGNQLVSFPRAGKWYNYFTGEELNVTAVQISLGFRPNEFYLFTDKPLPKPESGILQEDFVTSIPEIIPAGDFKVYPVPTATKLTVELPQDMIQANYRVVDMAGRVVFDGQTDKGEQILDFDLSGIQAGIYIFEAFDTKRVLHKRFIKE
jgi:hypothetical protein